MWVITGARFLNLYLENFAEMLKLQECFLTNNMADKQKLLNCLILYACVTCGYDNGAKRPSLKIVIKLSPKTPIKFKELQEKASQQAL